MKTTLAVKPAIGTRIPTGTIPTGTAPTVARIPDPAQDKTERLARVQAAIVRFYKSQGLA